MTVIAPLIVNAPCETTSAGCVVSPLVDVGVKVNETAWEPRLTVPPEAPLMAAAVDPRVVPVPLALSVVLLLKV